MSVSARTRTEYADCTFFLKSILDISCQKYFCSSSRPRKTRVACRPQVFLYKLRDSCRKQTKTLIHARRRKPKRRSESKTALARCISKKEILLIIISRPERRKIPSSLPKRRKFTVFERPDTVNFIIEFLVSSVVKKKIFWIIVQKHYEKRSFRNVKKKKKKYLEYQFQLIFCFLVFGANRRKQCITDHRTLDKSSETTCKYLLFFAPVRVLTCQETVYEMNIRLLITFRFNFWKHTEILYWRMVEINFCCVTFYFYITKVYVLVNFNDWIRVFTK